MTRSRSASPDRAASASGMGREMAQAFPEAREVFDRGLADARLRPAQGLLRRADRAALRDGHHPAGARRRRRWRASRGPGQARRRARRRGRPQRRRVRRARRGRSVDVGLVVRLVRERGLAMAAARGQAPARWPPCSDWTTRRSSGCAPRPTTCGRRTTTARARSSSPAASEGVAALSARRRRARRKVVRLRVSGAFHSPLVDDRRAAPRPVSRAPISASRRRGSCRPCRAGSRRRERIRRAPGRAAHGAGAVHAGRAGPACRRRRHVRRDRPGQSSGRAREADRPSVTAVSIGTPEELAAAEASLAGCAELDGRVALVTGGSRGIGAAICAELARAGAEVVVNYAANAEAADGVVGRDRRPAARRVLRPTSRPPTARRRWSTQVEADIGPIAILVNNAGITRDNLIMRLERRATGARSSTRTWAARSSPAVPSRGR